MGNKLIQMNRNSKEQDKLINSTTVSYINDNKHPRQSSRLEWSESSWTHCLYIWFWWWINPILSIGSKRYLTENDFDDLPPNDKSFRLLNRLNSYNLNQKSIWKLIVKEYWKEYLFSSIYFIPYSLVRISQPLLIRQILIQIVNKEESSGKLYFIGLIYMICNMCTALFSRQNIFRSIRIGVRIRNTLIAFLFHRSLSMKLSTYQQLNTGQIINLITNDTTKFEDVFSYLHYLWLGSFDAIIIFGLLAWLIGPLPAFFGLIVLILFILTQLFIGRQYHQYRSKTAICSDKRVQALNEFIHGYYYIKTNNWEKLIEDQIGELRRQESISIAQSSHFRTFVMSLPTISIPIISFSIFSSHFLLGYSLDVVNTFTALALLVQMRSTVSNFMTTAIDKLNDVRTASQRIDSFIQLTHPKQPQQQQQDLPSSLSSMNDQPKGSILMSNASFTWYDNKPCLTSINLNIEPGQLIAILGPVGSGKSSLLLSLLGEMNLVSGQMNLHHNTFSYSSQSPWIFADTLRNNIVVNQRFDAERYRDVIYGCCLDVDIELFGPSRDQTMIGERGVNLSGGQQARVALARALYIQSDVYLFDDLLSSVDHHVGKQIYERCISQNGLLKDKTRLYVTHQMQFVKDVNQIISLSHGQIHHFNHHLIIKDPIENEEFENIFDDKQSILDINPIINEEVLVHGNVHWSIWYRLFSAPPSGKYGLCLLIILLLVGELFYDSTNYWLSKQLRNSPLDKDQHSSEFIWIYFSLTLCIILSNLFRYDYFFRQILNGCNDYHHKMLNGLFHTSIDFFQSNPSGRILNRISKDQQVIDHLLPGIVLDGLIALLILLGSIVITCFINFYVLMIFVIFIPILFYLSRYYLRISLEIKRIESVTRSPIYDLFSSSLNGLSSIRAFQMEHHLIQLLTNRIDENTMVYLSMKGASQWFAVRLQCLASLTVFLIVILLIRFRNEINPSLIGLSLMYTISQSFWIHWTIAQLAEAHVLITSAERIDQYRKLPQEEDLGGEQRLVQIPPEWPSDGIIEFCNYSLSYRTGLEPVLKNLNFQIKSGEKIGIIGRTGAGKSSLFKGIFRFLHRSNIQGHILIDGIDISRIRLNDLRSHLSIIPQQSILFSGTLRYNIDPFNHYSDEQCWMALEDVQLKQLIANHSSGLQMSISESGANLSTGQCQLICIARVILKKSPILLIDEATANVDQKTDDIIQQVMTKIFHDRTILTIAHRLNTIDKSDRILLLDKGILVDFDTPKHILQYYH